MAQSSAPPSASTIAPRTESARPLAAFDDWLVVPGRYPAACAIAILIGWLIYAPIWRSHFYADDVDFFGGMVAARSAGQFSLWLWTPGNGHFSIPSKLEYWLVWRFLGRD